MHASVSYLAETFYPQISLTKNNIFIFTVLFAVGGIYSSTYPEWVNFLFLELSSIDLSSNLVFCSLI